MPVKKPEKQDFVRVHPDLRLYSAALVELKDDREIYLVLPELVSELPGEFYIADLRLAINRQGVVFLWPIRGPGPDGRYIQWHQSAADCAELAETRWIRVVPNMSLGAYEPHTIRKTKVIRLWRDKFGCRSPYWTDAGALFVAYYASAELGCHLALGWPTPTRVLDLYVEFRRHTNGREH